MKKVLTLLLVSILCTLSVEAKVKTASGTAGGYACTLYYEETRDGFRFIKYAYRSTLKKNPNSRSSYLYINRTLPGQSFESIRVPVKDSKGNVVEYWDVTPWYYHGVFSLTGTATTTRGKTFDIEFSW